MVKQVAVVVMLAIAASDSGAVAADGAYQPPDLAGVTWLDQPRHDPVVLVEDGGARCVVHVAAGRGGKDDAVPPPFLKQFVAELVACIKASTGATLEVVDAAPAPDQPAIIIGDCAESRQAGIDPAGLPAEGFVVKTAAGRVYLVGSRHPLPGKPNGGVAWAVGTNEALLQAIFATPLKWVVMFAPLAMVFAFGAMINRLSVAAAQLFFYVFAAVMGLSISYIFAVYTGTSIAQTFLVTAIAFAGLSLYGYTTKKDLSGMGTFLMMGLIGLIVASIVNIFLASSAMAFAISVIGVLIFAGLTAFDTQNIKNTYLEHAMHGDQEWLGKSAIIGALNLYMNFLNMFMFLLQFLGNRE